jgi:hypothetical protein
MNWTDRDPPETDLLLQMAIPHDGGGSPCRLEIDKLPDGQYRVTVGTLLEALELCRTSYLEMLLRLTYRLGVSRSFREVLTALQQLSELAADLGHANLQGANLARDLTQEQLDTASGDGPDASARGPHQAGALAQVVAQVAQDRRNRRPAGDTTG